MTFAQLQKAYQDWVLHMHAEYDEEFNCGDDVPVWLLNASNKEALGIKSNGKARDKSFSSFYCFNIAFQNSLVFCAVPLVIILC